MSNVKGKDNYVTMPQINSVDIVPSGGTAGQTLTKTSGTSYDYGWATPVAGVTSVSGTANQIAVTGTGVAPIVGLATNPIVPGTGSIILPIGTTAQRPVSPTSGMLRFNTTIGAEEVYQVGSWVQNVGILQKSVVTQTFTAAAGGNILNTTIPAGVLGANRMLRIRIGGYLLNNSGGNRSITPSVSYGGVTLWEDVSSTIPSGATRAAGFHFDLILAANNSASSQTLNGMITLGGTGSQTVGTTGDLVTDEITGNAVITGSSAVNSAVNQQLVISVSFNGDLNGAGGGFFSNFYYIEVL